MGIPVKNLLKPVRHTTARGGQYILPIDILRSETGRSVIARHAALKDAEDLQVAEKGELVELSRTIAKQVVSKRSGTYIHIPFKGK